MDALVTGQRPSHLDGCDLCTSRAHALGLWFDDVRDRSIELADRAFPAERLAFSGV